MGRLLKRVLRLREQCRLCGDPLLYPAYPPHKRRVYTKTQCHGHRFGEGRKYGRGNTVNFCSYACREDYETTLEDLAGGDDGVRLRDP